MMAGHCSFCGENVGLYELMKGTVKQYLELKGKEGDEFSLSARQGHVNISLDDKIQSAALRTVVSHSTGKAPAKETNPEH